MEETMKKAVLWQFGQPLTIETCPIPTPGEGEILVKVMASGLCVSDVHIQDGIISSVHLPYTPGHEMVGIVCRLGPGVPEGILVPGQHVVCAIDITCGRCRLCRIGRKNLCLNRIRIGFERDGSHEEYAVVPYENLLPISSRIPFAQAAIIPDAVACMYHAVVSQGKVTKGTRVLFYGTGALGLQGVQIARYCGAEIYAAARTQAKLNKAMEFGAHVVINTKQQDLHSELLRLTDGNLCDVIFDLVGNDDTIDELLGCVRPGGKIVALAYGSPAFRINCQELVIKEKEVLGLRGSTREELQECIRLVENGTLTPYVSNLYRLEQINDALAALRACSSLGRSAIVFDD